MSAAMAREARAANKAKAHRMANGSAAEASADNAGPGDDPSKRVDASGWAEPNMLAEAKTGMRPVSRRQYRSGGKVEGKKAVARADKKSRGADSYINRDVRAANHEIAQPHIGGFSTGGATNFRKQMHAEMCVPENHHGRRNGVGKFHRSHKAAGGGNWIADATKNKGALHRKLHVPKGEKIPAKKLAKAAHSSNPTEAKEANLAKTLKRLHHAEGGAAKDVHKHERHMHKGEPLTRLGKASGGSTYDIAGMRPKGGRMAHAKGGKAGKGKTNIIIGIHAGGAHQPPQMPPGAGMPPRPAAPPPMPPQGMPPAGAPAGMGMMPPGMGMPRASGGKVAGAKYGDASIAKAEKVKSPKNMPAGGGGGLGRLAKRSMAMKDGFRPV